MDRYGNRNIRQQKNFDSVNRNEKITKNGNEMEKTVKKETELKLKIFHNLNHSVYMLIYFIHILLI